MAPSPQQPARPPASPYPLTGWPGVAREQSRTLEVLSTAEPDAGTWRTWHYLDNQAELDRRGLRPVGTLLCVHGNPTWSYLWRELVGAGATAGTQPWRVVAVDQLDMGYSERTGTTRRLADRITDLGDFTAALGLDAPGTGHGVVTVAHDWGGLVSQGWGARHPGLHAGRILTNTALHHELDTQIPAALRLALHPAVHGPGTRSTTAFLDVTLSLHRGTWDPETKKTFLAPYGSSSRRQGIQNFVADIPADPSHPSHATMLEISQSVQEDGLPSLILWGPYDPVFQQRYFDDLLHRLPQAQVHRFEASGHLVAEDQELAPPVFAWLHEAFEAPTTREQEHRSAREQASLASPLTIDHRPMSAELEARRTDDSVAVVDMGPATGPRGGTIQKKLTWRQLNAEVDRVCAVLRDQGVAPGTRVSLMVPPGIRLTTLVYACLRIGAVIVVADTGLGLKGLGRALRGASPAFLIGIPSALVAARAAGWPGRRILAGKGSRTVLKALGAVAALDSARPGPQARQLPGPQADDLAAVLFTSGSTGPAKGVAYTHRQLAAMRNAIQNTYRISPGSGLVAGFAPFALLGPALGATSVTPDMDVTSPKTLSARALAQAAKAIDATVVFASPAALLNVVATESGLAVEERVALGKVQRLLSAGAPLSIPALQAVARLVPQAEIHTPYGMTEALPITDISLPQILEADRDAEPGHGVPGAGGGVCVGTPVYGARAELLPLDHDGHPASEPSREVGTTGEIIVAADHVKDHYDRLWWTEQDSIRVPGWHRTGDVGHFDAAGRLWVSGRLSHVLRTEDGVLAPVPAELAAETVPAVRRAALVGVGPAGAQVPVVVIEVPGCEPGPAGLDLTAEVRRAVQDATGASAAAVLQVREHPTDIRHNSKIDRPRLAAWATEVLSGGKVRKP